MQTPAWSMKFTGTVEGVKTRVAAQAAPFENPPLDDKGQPAGEPLNVMQFAAIQAIVKDMLNRSPVPSVAVLAQGYHAADGRAEITIRFEPVELHV